MIESIKSIKVARRRSSSREIYGDKTEEKRKMQGSTQLGSGRSRVGRRNIVLAREMRDRNGQSIKRHSGAGMLEQIRLT